MTEPKSQNKIMYYLGEFWKNQTYLAIVAILVVIVVGFYGVFSLTNTVLSFIDTQVIIATSKKETKGQINADARGYLKAAESITQKYIIPSGIKKGAYKNSETLMYKIRDDLYNKGMNLLDPDDGEREIWWWKIRYKEFDKAYGEQIPHKYYHLDNPKIKPKENVKLFEWHDEILKHIQMFPYAKPKDKQYLKCKHSMFITMLIAFNNVTYDLNISFNPSTDIIRKNQNLKKSLEIVDKSYRYYKSIVNKEEKEGIDRLHSNHKLMIKEMAYRERFADDMLKTYETLGELDCNNEYFSIYVDNVYKRLTYIKENFDYSFVTLPPYLNDYGGYYRFNKRHCELETSKQSCKDFDNKCREQPGYKKYYALLNEANEAREAFVNRKDEREISPDNKLYQLKSQINKLEINRYNYIYCNRGDLSK